MKTIEKKVWPEYFQEILNGKKTFELRLNDFAANEGDLLLLREWDPKTNSYTGREIKKNVRYIFKTRIEELTKFWEKEKIEENGIQIISLRD